MCKLLNKGLVSEPVLKLWAVEDVAKLKQLLYKNERKLRHYPPKSLLLKDAIDFKHLFYTLDTFSCDPIRTEPFQILDNSTENYNHLLRQYYLERLRSTKIFQTHDTTTLINRQEDQNRIGSHFQYLIEIATRSYIEGFHWHLAYLDCCIAKSGCIQQKYVKQLQQKCTESAQSEMNKSDTCTKNNNILHGVTDPTTDILVAKLNKLNLNSNNLSQTTTNQSILPTIVLTDYSQVTDNDSDIILSDNSYKETTLSIPNIRCRVESRPPTNI